MLVVVGVGVGGSGITQFEVAGSHGMQSSSATSSSSLLPYTQGGFVGEAVGAGAFVGAGAGGDGFVGVGVGALVGFGVGPVVGFGLGPVVGFGCTRNLLQTLRGLHDIECFAVGPEKCMRILKIMHM